MTDTRNTAIVAAILGALLLGSTASAAIDPQRLYLAANGQIPWQSLSREEQEALQKYRRSWDSYDSERQQRIREGARRFQSLPPDKRRQIRQKRQEYERLSPEERRRLREEYQRRHN